MTKANVISEPVLNFDASVKKKLELIPNEVIGFRIRPDNWNWSVVVVKVHGKDSKNAGQQYESPLPAYCKSIEHAIEVIFNRVAAMEGRKLQDETFDQSGICCDLESLKTAFVKAKEAALWSVKDLEQRLTDVGIELKDVPKLMGKPLGADDTDGGEEVIK